MSGETASAKFRELLNAAQDEFDDQLVPFFEPEEELIYQVRRPRSAESTDPPGALIYISPKAGARMPEAWGHVLDKHNLVWVGAEDSGNEVHVARRVGFALLAPAIAALGGTLDASRTLLTGFSGGGRVASMMMPAYPQRFAGAIFICGANPLFTVTQAAIDILGQCPMVFLTGTDDFNFEDTQVAISTYQQAGMALAQLMVVQGMGHALPPGNEVDKALARLSSMAVSSSPKQFR